MRPHINEILIDQIPNLAALLRFLEQLAVTEPPQYKMDLIIEQISEIYENMITKYKGKWKEIAKAQAKYFLSLTDEEIKDRAKR